MNTSRFRLQSCSSRVVESAYELFSVRRTLNMVDSKKERGSTTALPKDLLRESIES